MANLGFTFYPKDWWTSDSFFILSPFERYVYLELLFMMYSNNGFVSNNKAVVEGRLRTTIKDEVWSKITDLLVEDGDKLTHRSVNKRLSKTLANRENGRKGGAPKGNLNARKTTQTTQKNNPNTEVEKQPKNNLKTTKTTGCFENVDEVDFVTDCNSDEKQPKQPKKTTQNNPPYKIEIEIEREIEDEEEKNARARADGDGFPSTDSDRKPWHKKSMEEIEKEMLSAEAWHGDFGTSLGIKDPADVPKWIAMFFRFLRGTGKEHFTSREAKTHCHSWTRRQLELGKTPDSGPIAVVAELDNPNRPPDNSGRWLFLNGKWRDTTTFTNAQKRKLGLLPEVTQ